MILFMSVNKVILVGRLGQNPEIRYTPSGAAVANFSIATSESWLDKAGQKQERAEWHRIVVWGKQAESCGQYLAKGKQVYVEGRLQTRQWQDKEGQAKSTTEVHAQTVQFLGAAGGGAGGAASSGERFQPNPGAGLMRQEGMSAHENTGYGQAAAPQYAQAAGGFGSGPMSSSLGFQGGFQGGGQGGSQGGFQGPDYGGGSGALGGGGSEGQSSSPGSSALSMEPAFTEDDVPF